MTNVNVQTPTVRVSVGGNEVRVIIPLAAVPPTSNPPGWHAALEYYEDDIEARANGLTTGQCYKVKTTGGILSAKRGTVVEVEDE